MASYRVIFVVSLSVVAAALVCTIIVLTCRHRNDMMTDLYNRHRWLSEAALIPIPTCAIRPRIQVYFINLEKDVDRCQFMLSHNSLPAISSQLSFVRCDAVQGDNSILKTSGIVGGVNVNVDPSYFSKGGIPSKILACTASHLLAIRRAFIDGCDVAIIAEDDAAFNLLGYHTCIRTVSDAIASSPPSIVSLFNASNRNASYDGEDIFFGGFSWGTQAYMINRSGMKYLTENTFQNDVLHIRPSTCTAAVADEYIYSVIPNMFTVYSSYVYPYNVRMTSTLHSTHDAFHMRWAFKAIERTLAATQRRRGGKRTAILNTKL